jgi:hypothetical protein
MNSHRERNNRHISALIPGTILSVVLLASAPAAHAQATQSDTAETTANEQEQEQAQPAAASPEAPAPATRTERSPSDYRSSEEISEDRSVSFPVDI